jgi:hypothetical protein
LEGRHAAQRVGAGRHIAGIVVGQGRRAIERIGRGEEAAQGVVGKGGGGVGWIERIARFGQEPLDIVEEPRDLVVRVGDRKRIAFDVIREIGLIAFGVGNTGHLVAHRFIDKRGRK